MRRWGETARRIAATTRTSEKTRLLAEALARLAPDELAPAATWFTGRPFPESDQRSTGLGWATIAEVATRLAGVPPAAIGAAYDRSSDLGTAVGEVLAGRPEPPDPAASPSIRDVADAFAAIEAASGTAAKGAILESLLARCDAATATAIAKILAGELRIGLREGLLEAAIARAFDRPLADVQWAGMLTGDVGEVAVLARDDRLAGARLRLFHPLRFMLASPAEDAAAIIARLGPVAWVEDKYDGIRAQLHRQGDDVRIWSRDLNEIGGQFPEVVAAAAGLAWDGILDGELLAIRDGTVLPFLALQKRLGRKAPPDRLLAEVPVAFVAFDALALGSRASEVEPLLRRPLAERRARLEALELPLAAPGRLALSHVESVDSIDGLEEAFARARARRNEGLMVKDPASSYSPGRRGYGWLKMKKALATLDCVVVGVEVGHGKRHGVLSDYTFAVRDEATGGLATIGKAYTGLTDAEIAEMTAWFEAHTIRRLGRYRVVEPSVVVEVAFDVIQRSGRHASGFALRFPRIVRLRTDKSAADVDTLATVATLWRELQAGAEHLVTMTVTRSGLAPVGKAQE
ncbi:MAG: ligase [Chloroflexi bacterium]|nr:ligase [Chloroflexota bacterium]